MLENSHKASNHQYYYLLKLFIQKDISIALNVNVLIQSYFR